MRFKDTIPGIIDDLIDRKQFNEATALELINDITPYLTQEETHEAIKKIIDKLPCKD